MIEEKFSHEGRHLREWMLQLVEEEPERRVSAAAVITNKSFGDVDFAEVTAEWDAERGRAEFQEAIRVILKQDGFPAAEYVQKLFVLEMLLEKQRMSEWKKKNQRDDEIFDEFAKKLGETPSEAELKRYYKRVCIHIRRECQATEDQMPEALSTGITIAMVIDALGAELLPAAEQIRVMLKEKYQCHIASGAICRMGAEAIEFYPDLMEGLKQEDLNSYYAKPLGHLLRHYPEKVKGIYQLTSDSSPTVRRNAIQTLTHCGRDTIQQFPEIEKCARERLQAAPEEEWHVWAWLLGKTAVTSPTVTLLLESTQSMNPQHVGTAISCLGEMRVENERVVPRLIELIDEFEEYDSDWEYHGEYGRFIATLENFGDSAKAAIPKLAQHIWSRPLDYYTKDFTLAKRPEPNEDVVKFLARFGHEAREILPALREMKAELIRRRMQEIPEEGGQAPQNPEDCCPEYLLKAIAKIEKSQKEDGV